MKKAERVALALRMAEIRASIVETYYRIAANERRRPFTATARPQRRRKQ